LELQNPVVGHYILTVTWDMPRAHPTNLVEYTGIEVLGVERENGFVAVLAQPPLLAVEKNAPDLLRLDAREWPEWPGGARDNAVLTYRYLRPGYRLVLAVQRFLDAEVLQALVDSAELTTVAAEDGQTMTEMKLSVRNHGRQFLQVELASGARVWSAFVDGQPVRPCSRQGKTLLPLERSSGSGEPISVEMTFIETNKFPRLRGSWSAASPKLDVPWKNAVWKFYLPQDYRYSRFRGTMTPQPATDAARISRYSLSEYTEQENLNRSSASMSWRYGLQAAQSKLAEGNIKEAADNYRQVKLKAGQGATPRAAEEQQLKQLETELGRMQGQNLIQAQNDFSFRNQGGVAVTNLQMPVGGAAGFPNQAAQSAGAFNFDTDAAARQWSKLQQIQDVAVAKLQPLRANLPLRGVLLSFKQALQTEMQKPLTVELFAANTRTIGWGRSALTVFGVFLVLWMTIALWPCHRSS
jgi:hypothetical protein